MKIPFLPKNKYVTLTIFITLVLFYKFYLKDFESNFDKNSWQTIESNDYSHREALLPNLFNNYELIGMSEKTIIDLLGKPHQEFYTNNNKLYYPTEIIINNKKPVFAKGLLIQMNGNRIVISYKLKEWKKY